MSSFRGNAPSSPGFWSIERVVALLTPLFGAASGLIVTYIAKIVPGVHLAPGDVTALFIAGATLAGAAALKWLHGRQKFVNFATDSGHIVQEVVRQLSAVGGVPLADIEKVLQAHEAAIVQALGSVVHAPPSAEEIAQKLVQQLWPAQAAAARPAEAS